MSVILIDAAFHDADVIFEMCTHTYIVIGDGQRCEQRSAPLAVLQVAERLYILWAEVRLRFLRIYIDARPEEFRHSNSFRYLLQALHVIDLATGLSLFHYVCGT